MLLIREEKKSKENKKKKIDSRTQLQRYNPKKEEKTKSFISLTNEKAALIANEKRKGSLAH